MVNNTSKIDIKNGLRIKSHLPVPIEKPFSKTHAPMFGLMLDRNF
jgi:hypothetical protein